MTLVNVPSDALCLELLLSSSAIPSDPQSQRYGITPGTSPTVEMDGLPPGAAAITAMTFGVACAQVQASTPITWIVGDPVPVTLVAAQTVNASVVLRRPGNVQVTATFDDGSLTITPAALSFGSIPVGSSSNLAFTVTNPGTTAISLTAPAITGTDAAHFALVAGSSTCGSSLAAGASCTGLASFRPTSGGAKSATLTVGSLSAPMTGTGVVSPLVINPSTLSFGSVAVGNTSITLTVTMTNTSSVTLSTSATSATGDINQFNANGPGSNCGASLAAGASCTSLVFFAPTSAGTKSAVWTMAGSTLTLDGVATPTPVYRINCGSSSAVSPFTADQYSSGGTQHSVTNTINLSGVASAAPQAVYQSERYGNSTYTVPGLTASATYTVRLHFAELYWSATGKRKFSVAVNGTTVLSSFDIYAAAGANYKAVVREFTTTANASGQIVVSLTTVTDNASISGIEILR